MIRVRLLVLLACFGLAACSAQDEPEFCRNHALFHAEHAASTVNASVTMAVDGGIVSEFRLPVSIFGGQMTTNVLQDDSRVIALQTATECTTNKIRIESRQESIIATYTADCGADNKLEQIDVLLFESLPELNEVDVTVTTPVTSKHFAIHRQCDSAIFRLE